MAGNVRLSRDERLQRAGALIDQQEKIVDGLQGLVTVRLCPLAVVRYVLTEAGSVAENAGSMGAPIPEWLTKAIAALKDKVDERAGKTE